MRSDFSLLGCIYWSTYFLLRTSESERAIGMRSFTVSPDRRISASSLSTACLVCLVLVGLGCFGFVLSEGIAVDVVLSHHQCLCFVC